MKKLRKPLIILAVLLTVISCVSCTKEEKQVAIKEIAPYIYEAETYTKLDYKTAEAFYARNYDKWGVWIA